MLSANAMPYISPFSSRLSPRDSASLAWSQGRLFQRIVCAQWNIQLIIRVP